MLIDKQTILKKLEKRFTDNNKVHAFWLEGSDAMGCSDEYSDIDIWFDVEDDYIDTFVDEIKVTLKSISPMEFYYESPITSYLNILEILIGAFFFMVPATMEFSQIDIEPIQ